MARVIISIFDEKHVFQFCETVWHFMLWQMNENRIRKCRKWKMLHEDDILESGPLGTLRYEMFPYKMTAIGIMCVIRDIWTNFKLGWRHGIKFMCIRHISVCVCRWFSVIYIENAINFLWPCYETKKIAKSLSVSVFVKANQTKPNHANKLNQGIIGPIFDCTNALALYLTSTHSKLKQDNHIVHHDKQILLGKPFLGFPSQHLHLLFFHFIFSLFIKSLFSW